MTYTITSGCIDILDRSCLEACPVDCIEFEAGRDRMAFINARECIDCGACVERCPVTAIFAEDEVPQDEREFIDINRLYFRRRKAARTALQRAIPEVLSARGA